MSIRETRASIGGISYILETDTTTGEFSRVNIAPDKSEQVFIEVEDEAGNIAEDSTRRLIVTNGGMSEEKNIEISALRFEQLRTIYYEGDLEVGIKIFIHALGPATNITIHNVNTRKMMSISSSRLIQLTGEDIHEGDDIIISTVRGNKSATLYRDGIYTNILNCLNRDAEWFTLSRGDNLLLYTADTGDSNLQFRIENKILYEGV